MDYAVFDAVANGFANNILTKPEFFIGILVFIGYLFLGKPIYEAFAGFIKATWYDDLDCRFWWIG